MPRKFLPVVHVYVEQYGSFWKLTLQEWFVVLRAGASGNGYTLPEKKQMVGVPRCITFSSGREIVVMTPGQLFYRPRKWEPEDFRDNLEELTERYPEYTKEVDNV